MNSYCDLCSISHRSLDITPPSWKPHYPIFVCAVDRGSDSSNLRCNEKPRDLSVSRFVTIHSRQRHVMITATVATESKTVSLRQNYVYMTYFTDNKETIHNSFVRNKYI